VPADSILVARTGTAAFIKVKGKGSYRNAREAKEFVQISRSGGTNLFVFDLQACDHLDSTFLGILAHMAMENRDQKLPPPKLIRFSPRIRELLETLGIDRFLTLVDPPDLEHDPDYQTLALALDPEPAATATTMLQAHEALIAADSRNLSKFKDVVAFLREKVSR
jgi:anti-sigma B factor antagonist